MPNPPNTRYFLTPDPNVVIACDLDPISGQYNQHCRPMRLEDIPGHPMQPASAIGLHAALHSYVHVARQPSVRPIVKPYFKLYTPSAPPVRGSGARVPAARHAEQPAQDGGPWNLPDLCKAYNWPTGLAGGGVIAIVELGGGWVPA